jgi:hypothetical protein
LQYFNEPREGNLKCFAFCNAVLNIYSNFQIRRTKAETRPKKILLLAKMPKLRVFRYTCQASHFPCARPVLPAAGKQMGLGLNDPAAWASLLQYGTRPVPRAETNSTLQIAANSQDSNLTACNQRFYDATEA